MLAGDKSRDTINDINSYIVITYERGERKKCSWASVYIAA